MASMFTFGFSLVSSMVLSRYFPKEDYGTYKQVLYVYNTLLVAFTLGLPRTFTYFLPRVPENQAKSLIQRITGILFLLGGFFSLLLFIFSAQIAGVMKNPDLDLALKVFSPVPLLMLPTMGLEGILSTFRMTKFLTVYTIATRTMMLLFVVLPVILLNGGYLHAVVGFVFASFVAFLLALYFKNLPVKSRGNEKCTITFKEIFKFSIPVQLATVWGIVISSTDQFFISRYFGNVVFAEFTNGSTDIPFVGMIVGATATVLSPIFSKMSHQKLDPKKEIYPIWESVFEKSVKLIYPLIIYIWIFADVIMIFLYGKQYEQSAIYFRIFNFTYFFKIIAYAPLIINIGKVKYYANINMYSAILLVIAEFASVHLIDSPYAISVISVVFQIGRVYLMLKVVAQFFDLKVIQLFPMKLIMRIIIPSAVVLLIMHYIMVTIININYLVTLFVSFSIYILLYFFYSLKIKIDYVSIVKPLLYDFGLTKKKK